MSSFDGIYGVNTASLDGLSTLDVSGDINSAISVYNTYVSNNYLLLDTSNDPLTGTLAINGNITTTGTGSFADAVFLSNGVNVNADITIDNPLTDSNIFMYCQTGSVNRIAMTDNTDITFIEQRGTTIDFNAQSSDIMLTINGNLSVSNDTTFRGAFHNFYGSTSFDNSNSTLRLSGKQTSFSVSNLPYRSKDVVGGKQYSGQDLLMIDNSTFFAGTVIRISVSELLKDFTGAVSVNNNLTIQGTTSISGALTLGTLPIGGISDLNYYDMGPNVGTNEWDSGTFTAMPSGDYVIWWSFSHKSTTTTTSGAGHLLEYYDNTGTWIQAIADYTNISTANVEFSNSRNRVINIGSTFTKIRVRVGTLCVSGTQTLIFTDVIMTRKFF